ncbi:hypothetical protein [Bdellovibrio sp. ArHS]|uniref:hypothetical protein n=1 Tax=Bdellovibrio sp. ArHS TaxID=1569284 RepID=UPI0025C727A7|nr:hypothetical protein [Bdellovibrio sp. ArHS]
MDTVGYQKRYKSVAEFMSLGRSGAATPKEAKSIIVAKMNCIGRPPEYNQNQKEVPQEQAPHSGRDEKQPASFLAWYLTNF